MDSAAEAAARTICPRPAARSRARRCAALLRRREDRLPRHTASAGTQIEEETREGHRTASGRRSRHRLRRRRTRSPRPPQGAQFFATSTPRPASSAAPWSTATRRARPSCAARGGRSRLTQRADAGRPPRDRPGSPSTRPRNRTVQTADIQRRWLTFFGERGHTVVPVGVARERRPDAAVHGGRHGALHPVPHRTSCRRRSRAPRACRSASAPSTSKRSARPPATARSSR